MPITRSGAPTNHVSARARPASSRQSYKPSSNGKKWDLVIENESTKPDAKKSKTKTKSTVKGNQNSREASNPEDHGPRPRLTTPDLEFDYDRSQLRDPRPTPGRMNRPQYEEIMDREIVTEEWKSKYYIPLTATPSRLMTQKSIALRKERSKLNPLDSSHDLYVCHQKGLNGSPTYDSAGFQLDWRKVDKSMKPVAYNKKRMMNGMERALDKGEKDFQDMAEIFFSNYERPSSPHPIHHDYEDYMKDQVSKDLQIPFHQNHTPALQILEV